MEADVTITGDLGEPAGGALRISGANDQEVSECRSGSHAGSS
jgi:hypothetical protein